MRRAVMGAALEYMTIRRPLQQIAVRSLQKMEGLNRKAWVWTKMTFDIHCRVAENGTPAGRRSIVKAGHTFSVPGLLE